MEELAPGFDQLTTKAVDGAQRMAQRSNLEQRANESIELKKIKEAKDPKSASIKQMKQNFDMAREVQADFAKKDKDLQKRKEKARRKCTKFKLHPLFKDSLKLIALPPVGGSCEEWEACLETIKTELGSFKAIETLWEYMAWICGGIEGLSRAYPEIFGNINLSKPYSLEQLMRDPRVHKKLEQEATELSILYDEWLTSRAEMRFVKGLAVVVKELAMQNAIAGTKSVSPEELGRQQPKAN